MYSTLSPELKREGKKIAKIIRELRAADPNQPITISFANQGRELYIPGDTRKRDTRKSKKRRK